MSPPDLWLRSGSAEATQLPIELLISKIASSSVSFGVGGEWETKSFGLLLAIFGLEV